MYLCCWIQYNRKQCGTDRDTEQELRSKNQLKYLSRIERHPYEASFVLLSGFSWRTTASTIKGEKKKQTRKKFCSYSWTWFIYVPAPLAISVPSSALGPVSVPVPSPGLVSVPAHRPVSVLVPAYGLVSVPVAASGLVSIPAPGPVSVISPALGHVSVPAPALGLVSVSAPALGHVSVPAPALGLVSVPAPALGHVSVPSPSLGPVLVPYPALGHVSVPSSCLGPVLVPYPALGHVSVEKYRDGQRELHCVFVDLEKAYDRVPREELWYCMRKSGVAEKYVRVVQDMYERSRTVVRCAVGQTEEFKVEVGLHQGSALSPFLFAIVIESREQVKENLERWRFALERRGMKVSHIQSNGECGKEVKKRVQAGWNGWRKVSGVLCDRKISARIKGKVYRTVVRPAMLYGLETVSLRKRQESELEVAELKMLRFGKYSKDIHAKTKLKLHNRFQYYTGFSIMGLVSRAKVSEPRLKVTLTPKTPQRSTPPAQNRKVCTLEITPTNPQDLKNYGGRKTSSLILHCCQLPGQLFTPLESETRYVFRQKLKEEVEEVEVEVEVQKITVEEGVKEVEVQEVEEELKVEEVKVKTPGRRNHCETVEAGYRVQGVAKTPDFPLPNLIKYLWHVLDRQIPSTEVPPNNVKDQLPCLNS
ncbi:hypothetical protein QTP70_010893 [Hemibagrus guttatus]|uniref:Reverse transcriptase domain-containing protein n=1 Tax=Hemibagrus guttatus TaxID=175788 RepID=A0AAE0R7L0_9TELE|nr:hypothetical protein QTP70_010893 [Hemibagrus guttatus]